METWKRTISDLSFFRCLVCVVLIAIMVELGGVWIELSGIRHEQVKNAVYALRPESLAEIKKTRNATDHLRAMAGQSSISGSVTIESGFGPIHVQIDDSVLDPIYIQASDSLPVEIQR